MSETTQEEKAEKKKKFLVLLCALLTDLAKSVGLMSSSPARGLSPLH